MIPGSLITSLLSSSETIIPDVLYDVSFKPAQVNVNKIIESTPTNGTKATLSFWIKITESTDNSQVIPFIALNGTGYTQMAITNNQLLYGYSPDGVAGNIYKLGPTFLDDKLSWYHIVISYDSTLATPDDRIKFYLNGKLQTWNRGDLDIALNTTFPLSAVGANCYLFTLMGNGSGVYNNVYFIDGEALDSSYFGEIAPETNKWSPIEYLGTYGNLGFYLDFKGYRQSINAIGFDKSGNENHWPVQFPDGTIYYAPDNSIITQDAPTNNFASITLNDITGEVDDLYFGWQGWEFSPEYNPVKLSIPRYASLEKYYYEVDVRPTSPPDPLYYVGNDNVYYRADGKIIVDGVEVGTAPPWDTYYTIGCAVTVGGSIIFTRNGNVVFTTPGYASGVIAMGCTYYDGGFTIRFGDAGYLYPPPNSEYKSLCEYNLNNPHYEILKSLRFRNPTTYLSRTPAVSGDGSKWTLSLWFKQGAQAASYPNRILFSAVSDTGFTSLEIITSGFLQLRRYNSSTSTVDWTYTYSGRAHKDAGQWVHLVVQYDANNENASEKIKMLINGKPPSLVTPSNTPTPSLEVNQAGVAHYYGRGTNAASFMFDGNMAEVNFIDGEVVSADSFGRFNPLTGQWVPKKYTGTYGTNGHYLNFEDSADLGKDLSGNNNNYASTGFVVNATLPTYDLSEDTPANNYCVLNPFAHHLTLTTTQGNLFVSYPDPTTNNNPTIQSTFSVKEGKWYWEVELNSGYISAGVSSIDKYGSAMDYRTGGVYVSAANGSLYFASTTQTYSSAWTIAGGVIGIALDCDNGTIQFYKNGVALGVFTNVEILKNKELTPSISSANLIAGSASINFGQRPFKYSTPIGYKTLCTKNLPDSIVINPTKYYQSLRYTGNATETSINVLNFNPNFVISKAISNTNGATLDPYIIDSIRGTSKVLSTVTLSPEATDAEGVKSFNSNGSTIGTSPLANTLDALYQAMFLKESPTSGFDIISYIGTGANRTIPHNLGSTPVFMIIKKRTGTDSDWYIYHKDVGANQFFKLNTQDAVGTDVTIWNNTRPTDSVISIGTNTGVNGNGEQYIAYIFSEVDGYSDAGIYPGNGVTNDGPFIHTGFTPRLMFIKNVNATAPWVLIDSNFLFALGTLGIPFTSGVSQASYQLYPTNNGLKINQNSTFFNTNGINYVYFAIAGSSQKYSNGIA